MSPLPVLGAVGSGVLKVGTAKQMAKALKAMKETDWEAVNNAAVSMKDFAGSASLIQETIIDVKDQALALVDIALGTWLSTLAEKFNVLFEGLVPLATAFDELNARIASTNKEIDVVKIDEMSDEMFDVRQAWHDFWSTFLPAIFPPNLPPEAPIPPEMLEIPGNVSEDGY